jgi:hypothetical protein
MFKFIIIALVIIGAVTSFPPLRDRIMPKVSRAFGPTGEKLALPMKKWRAKSGCTNLLRELAVAQNQGKVMPTQGEFTAWAARATNDKQGGIDPWGKRYYIVHKRGVMKVGSPGPDGIRETPDDIVKSVPWES